MINEIGKAKLKDQRFLFNASVVGKFPEMNYPTDVRLEIAKGARVMILCNKKRSNSNEFEYVNGDIGVITSIENANGYSPMINIHLDNGNDVKVGPHTWSNNTYEMQEDSLSGRRFLV